MTRRTKEQDGTFICMFTRRNIYSIMELHYLSQWRQSLFNRWLERDLNVQLLAKLVETALSEESGMIQIIVISLLNLYSSVCQSLLPLFNVSTETSN